MSKLCIVCLDQDAQALEILATALEPRFAETHHIIRLSSSKEGIADLEALADRAEEVALFLCTQAVSASDKERFLEIAQGRFPKAMKVLLLDQHLDDTHLGAISHDGWDSYIRKPCEPQELRLTTENLLIRYELAARLSENQGTLERKNAHLEALHRVGVALAGSFDIDSILNQIATAVGQLVGEAPIDVFYTGSAAINSRPRWLPRVPGPGNLDREHRLQFEGRLGVGENGEPAEQTGMAPLEELLRQPECTNRHLVSIVQQDELLGFFLIKPKATLDEEDEELLHILSLQAATALRNIHLTQERIHFERLSAFGRMIGSLVHDFRSPLTAVRGYAGMLGGELPVHDRGEYARLAIEECDRLNHMISELLELSRGGRQELQLRSVRLGDFLVDLRPAMEAQFKLSDVRFEMELDYRGPILMDPDRMSRAVLNIASNASQAMNGGGVFTIRSERSLDKVILEFLDRGCGIPEEIRHRIFEPFFSYGKSQGIGLGMSITKKIVEEHGGKIGIASEVGRGTQIRFTLPLEPEDIPDP